MTEDPALSLIEDLLAYMSFSRPRTKGSLRGGSFHIFDGAEPLFEDAILNKLLGGDGTVWNVRGVQPRDIDWMLDQSFIHDGVLRIHPEREELIFSGREALFHAVRCRFLPPRALPRTVTVRAHTVLQLMNGLIMVDGTNELVSCHYAWVAGDWVPACVNAQTWHLHSPSLRRRAEAYRSFAMSQQFVRRYDWTVTIRLDDGPGVRFHTDPIGAREVFRLRDVPAGAARRAALLHWVQEHWRKKRSDPEEEAKVRAHLRGATKFSWNGLNCDIKPSAYDLERNTKKAKG